MRLALVSPKWLGGYSLLQPSLDMWYSAADPAADGHQVVVPDRRIERPLLSAAGSLPSDGRLAAWRWSPPSAVNEGSFVTGLRDILRAFQHAAELGSRPDVMPATPDFVTGTSPNDNYPHYDR